MASPYDISNASELVKSQLPADFKGNVYNLSYQWKDVIPVSPNPIKYLEIGAYHGANACSLMKTYAHHKDTEVHVIDPWQHYEGYDEYQTEQVSNYSLFIQNISRLSPQDLNKIYIHRGTSQNTISRFPNEHFDIIYIDGNHAKEYVLEDAVLALRKLKVGGVLIFDDLHCNDVKIGVQAFLHAYKEYMTEPIVRPGVQLFMQKKAK